MTTTTTTTAMTAPRMGIGYSTGWSGVVSSLPPNIAGAVASHVTNNAPRAADVPRSIAGYSGPTIPDLRTDPHVNNLANQVMAVLLREIPALAPAPSGPPAPPVGPTTAPTMAPPPAAHTPMFGGPGQQQHRGVDPGQHRLDLLQQQLDELRLQQLTAQQVPSHQVSSYQVPSYQVPSHHFDQMNQPSIGQFQMPHQDVQPQVMQPVSLDTLFSATIKCRQFKAVDFCKLGNFSYTGQIKQANMNLALFAYGSVKHFLALKDGTLPDVEPSEFISRLQHTLNVLEITCLGSNLSEFDSHSWRIGREYDQKVIRDIEQGFKAWNTFDRSIDPTSWAYARELVPPKSRPNNVGKSGDPKQVGGSGKVCTTWNTFKKDGCHYEHNNPGEVCVFQHFCSKCKARAQQKKHKAWQCSEPDSEQHSATSGAVTSSVTSAPTVTSG